MTVYGKRYVRVGGVSRWGRVTLNIQYFSKAQLYISLTAISMQNGGRGVGGNFSLQKGSTGPREIIRKKKNQMQMVQSEAI